ncbi:MAG: T9SS type A sorting domain-containing protein [Bacteroidales bacterium]|nr:T9SS type A sorting domain-containing protein [Bacteroidales bacterium]
MKLFNIRLFSLLLFSLLMLNSAVLSSQSKNHYEGPDYILMEAESTTSQLGKWITINEGGANYVNNASGKSHLEFTGNGINGGKANSPLTYKFTCPKDGTYRLLIKARKRLEGAESDKCNDGWVKMAGDFTSGVATLTTDDLKKNIKFFGGSAGGWGWAQKLDIHHAKHEALYNLKAGNEYTFTISGRSIRWNIDYILFYDTDAYSFNNAKSQLTFANAPVSLEKTSINNLKVFPNPVNDFISIKNENSSISKATLLTPDGRQVKQWNNLNHETTLDISKYSVGLYILQLRNDDNSVQSVQIIKK